MIQDLFCDIYSSIRDQHAWLTRVRFYSLLRWLTRQTANLILPCAWRICQNNKHLNDTRHPRIIVSLTTFPARINKIYLVIESLLRQSVLPDKIILWLSEEQYCSLDELPHSLLRLQNHGLEIRIVEGDRRSHKKYLYTLIEHPEDILVTVDDDIIYRSTMLEELMAQHRLFPDAIIAQYTHNMLYEADGSLKAYNRWVNNAAQGDYLFFGSGGGTLFPPKSLHKDVTDVETAMRVCPAADDIWLNAMARLAKTPIIHSDRYTVVLPVLNRLAQPLSADNMTNGNDVQLRKIIDYCNVQYGTNPFKK